MKFWKILKSHIEETLPEWQDKFLCYKDLKKELKLIYPQDARPMKRQRLNNDEVTKEVNDFVKLLEEEIDKFNSFFVEKEEDYIIHLKVLKERVAEMRKSNVEVNGLGRDIVDLHGEMVLLENYSALNYTGIPPLQLSSISNLNLIHSQINQLNMIPTETCGAVDALFLP
ncbi:hypothetical protein AABB24_014089 [Solanum stoloniferum]|uniref:SPX domain-containing protein n=1 Tax=Solanum stoloniferum TaxID=62892 RepID=A0ABD2TX11_9SOLN